MYSIIMYISITIIMFYYNVIEAMGVFIIFHRGEGWLPARSHSMAPRVIILSFSQQLCHLHYCIAVECWVIKSGKSAAFNLHNDCILCVGYIKQYLPTASSGNGLVQPTATHCGTLQSVQMRTNYL